MYSAQLQIVYYVLLSAVAHVIPWSSVLDLQYKATPYVVLDTHHVEPYIPSKYGESNSLRAYDHIDHISCYQKIWSSPSTDLQLRDTNTGTFHLRLPSRLILLGPCDSQDCTLCIWWRGCGDSGRHRGHCIVYTHDSEPLLRRSRNLHYRLGIFAP